MPSSPSKLKLTIDIRPLLEDQWTGIPVFTRRLIRCLQRNGELDLDFALDLVRLPRSSVETALALGTGAFLHETFVGLAGDDAQFVDFNAPILYPANKPHREHLEREASTVHDISTLVMPETHTEENVAYHLDYLQEELETDEVVFCISQATRAALLTALPSATEKARLLYQYVDWPEGFDRLERNMPRVGMGRYALVIGTVEPRKNLTLLIKALALPGIAQSELQFVVVGKKGWGTDSLLESLTPDQNRRLIFTGFVTEFIKYRLIVNAEFLIYPSIYEGFGIPALEAMSLGKPVLAARTSSFPEIIGDAGVYFDPYSPEEFIDALMEISSPRRLAELGPRAIAQNAKFGPERMAAPVVEWATGR